MLVRGTVAAGPGRPSRSPWNRHTSSSVGLKHTGHSRVNSSPSFGLLDFFQSLLAHPASQPFTVALTQYSESEKTWTSDLRVSRASPIKIAVNSARFDVASCIPPESSMRDKTSPVVVSTAISTKAHPPGPLAVPDPSDQSSTRRLMSPSRAVPAQPPSGTVGSSGAPRL